MPPETGSPVGPVLGGPVRRVFHALLSLAGWVLFVYWWWLVARRVSRHEVQFTITLIAVALIVVVSVTIIWAVHNVRIHRRRGARKANRPVTGDLARDTVGRAVRMPQLPEQCRTASVVRVRIAGGVKTYAPGTEGGRR